MAASGSLTVTGFERMMSGFVRLRLGLPKAIGAAMLPVAEEDMTHMKERTPVLTGALRTSGHVEGPLIKAGDISVRWVYGGSAAPYAAAVHQRHRTKSLFVQSVILERASTYGPRIAARLKPSIRGLVS